MSVSRIPGLLAEGHGLIPDLPAGSAGHVLVDEDRVVVVGGQIFPDGGDEAGDVGRAAGAFENLDPLRNGQDLPSLDRGIAAIAVQIDLQGILVKEASSVQREAG